ncbi:hypothetical protein GK047_26175 [Paenibacillus sp. SYP-B3998]|uniref:YwmB family TATA-box binding protein n=1 Tax=Paenibacillus sp. SYP-B3998 TaxID=2678564 RepID=A0A6G4A4N9_9BACL|nr:YwmB family TATA-box binding protein [Paenibacillus sp. SYP-B3998]NEW09433.1 hypothetical protein [Paenibacillus sp. SYP-B3998]
MQKFWFLSMLWIAITGIIFGWVRHAGAQGEQDALRLLNTVTPYMNGDDQITFKYTGYFGTCGESEEHLLQAGKQLSQAIGLPQTEGLIESNSSFIYKAELEVGIDEAVTVTVARPQGQSSCYMVLRIDASEGADSTHLIKKQDELSERLRKLQINGQWNVMVHGYVSPSVQLEAQQSSSELVKKIVKDFRGSIVESYSDINTISASLASDGFHSSIRSGNNIVNVQIALHQESTTGMWRLTVGTPIITMEY